MEYQYSYPSDSNLVLSLSGEMDASGSSQIRPALEEIAFKQESGNVLLDLQHVSFIDSSGIGAIVFLYKRLKAQKRSLVIRGVHGQPRELMELLHVDSAITMSLSNNYEPSYQPEFR